MSEFIQNISWAHLFWSAVFIALALVLWLGMKRFRAVVLARTDSALGESVRRTAAVNSVFNAIRLVIILLCALAVLQINGVNVTSMLAGLGIAGAIAGLAWQDMFKDFIQGIRILSDGFFSTGDHIFYNGEGYQVIEFSMRTTRLRDMLTGDVISVCNRNITEVKRISGTQLLRIGLSYEADMDSAAAVFTSAAEEIGERPDVQECRYLGFEAFGDSATEYTLSLSAEPARFYTARREAMTVLRRRLAEAGLEIPYHQVDIHMK